MLIIIFDIDYGYVLQTNFDGWFDTDARLTSPQFTFTGPVACFTFDFYFLADSSNHNTLSVTLLDQTNNNNSVIWSSTGLNIDNWEKAEVQIDQNSNYKVS